jgi:O-antigen/teichoic acid export membrane protein
MPKVRTHFFVELQLLRTLTSLLFALCFAALLLPHVQDPALYAVIAAQILLVAADISWFYQGIERFGSIALSTVLGRGCACVLIFLLVKRREDLLVYAAVYVGTLLLSYLPMWLGLGRHLVRVRVWRPKLRAHLLLSLGLFLSQLAIQIYTVVDKTMIGLITHSEAENGYYEQAQRVIRVAVLLVCAMGSVVASRVAILHKEKKKEELQSLLCHSARLALALAMPLALGMLLVAERFTPLFFGAGYAPVATLLRVLAPLVPIIALSNVLGVQLLAATGRERLLSRSVLLGAVLNILLNALLIPRYGALGAAIGSVFAELGVTLAQCRMLRRELPLGRLLLPLLRYGVLAALAVGAGLGVSLLVGEGILALVTIVFSCMLCYALLLLLLRDPVLRLLRGGQE